MDSLPPEVLLHIFTQAASSDLSPSEFYNLITLNKAVYSIYKAYSIQLARPLLHLLTRSWGCGQRCLQGLRLALLLEPYQIEHRWKHVRREESDEERDMWHVEWKGTKPVYREKCPKSCVSEAEFAKLLGQAEGAGDEWKTEDWAYALDIYIKSKQIMGGLLELWREIHPPPKIKKSRKKKNPEPVAPPPPPHEFTDSMTDCPSLLCDWFYYRCGAFVSASQYDQLQTWFRAPQNNSQLWTFFQKFVETEAPHLSGKYARYVEDEGTGNTISFVAYMLAKGSIKAVWEYVYQMDVEKTDVVFWRLGCLRPRGPSWTCYPSGCSLD